MSAQETFTKEQFWSELDAIGEDDVRVKFSVAKQWGDVGPKHALVLLWLKDKEDKRASASSAKRDLREQRTLYIAIAAMIIAAIAAHKEIALLISSVISWFR